MIYLSTDSKLVNGQNGNLLGSMSYLSHLAYFCFLLSFEIINYIVIKIYIPL